MTVDAPQDPAADESAEPAPSKRWLRLLLLVAVLVAIYLVGRALGAEEYLEREKIRDLVESAGPWGILIFVAAFALGELVHIPGVVFVGAAVLAWGDALGAVFSFLGAVVSVSVSFLVVRTIGGQPLAGVQRPFVKRILDRLDQRPIAVVIVLRLIFWMAPPINYALAMSKVSFRDYFLGSAIGLVVPVALAAYFIERILGWFGLS